MKRAGLLAVIMVMFGLGSCTSLSRKTTLKTDIDSLSFYFGMSRAEGATNYLVMQAGVDTTYLNAFYKGFRYGAKHFSPEDVAYLEGVRIAHMINNQWVKSLNYEIFMGDSGHTVSRNALLSGFYYGMRKSDDANNWQMQSYAQILIEKLKDTYRKEKYADLIAAGQKLLTDNKNNPEIKTTESGLQYKIITAGTGVIPDDKVKVKVNYRGTLVDGTEFDSSYKNNEPSTFHINSVITGWSEALKMMPAGSKWELYIPNELAYGATGQPPSIPPYSTLIFEVELLGIEK